jgi:osmotically-inducible protein OsmY
MRGGSVYEEGRGYSQSQGGYGSPDQGGYGGGYQSGGRRDYGGGQGGGYQEGGFGAGGYGQREAEGYAQGGGQPHYSGAGYGGGEPGYGGYQQRSGSSQKEYGQYGGQGEYGQRRQPDYGQGREPSSGAYGGAGLGGYSEGSSDIGRGFSGDYGQGREGRGYSQAGYSQGATYADSGEGGIWSGIKSGINQMLGGETEQRYGATERRGGGHRGRGPKGYQRSDERINEEVCQCLCDDDDLDASNIEVSVSSGEVTLTGHVPDRQSKRRAEDLTERISGVQNVQNSLRVSREGPTQQSQPDQSQSGRARARSPR